MLTRITVQGFKSLQDVEVELGQVNVFVGANGSGKSNLLEAVGFLSAATNRQVDDQLLSRRGVRLGIQYRSSFKTVQSPGGICIRAEWAWEQGIAGYQIDVSRKITDARRQPWSVKESLKFNGEEPKLSPTEHGYRAIDPPVEGFDYINSVLRDYAIFLPNTPVLRGLVSDITQRQPVGLAGGQLAEAVGELLDAERSVFGNLELDELLELLDWVDEIAIAHPSRETVSPSVPTTRNIIQFTDRRMADSNNQLSAHNASEGALYVLFALVLALHPQSPRLFAIDNFDQAMHPRLARATMRLFCQQILKASPERQALLTTHNPLVLDGLDLRDDRIRLFAVERNSKGATQVHRVQVSDEVLQATQEGLSLSNLWVMGRLGGVPDLF